MPLFVQPDDLLNAFRQGKEEGFTYFFNQFYKRLCYFANTCIKDMAAAEDIVGDSFIKIWAKRGIFETEDGLKNYLYRSVYNACIRQLDNRKRYKKHHDIFKLQVDTIEQNYINNIIKTETLYQLRQHINTLPNNCRQVFIKMYFEEKSVKEIANEMNITVSTVKNQKARGIKLLKPKLSS